MVWIQVGSDLGPYCLQKLSADDKSPRKKVASLIAVLLIAWCVNVHTQLTESSYFSKLCLCIEADPEGVHSNPFPAPRFYISY